MKILNQINDITMKVAKGMLSVFSINLILLLSIFVFNSCQTEDIQNQNIQETKNELLTSLSKSAEDISNTPITNRRILKNADNTILNASSYEYSSAQPIGHQTHQIICFSYNPNDVDLDSVMGDTDNLGDALGIDAELTSIDGVDFNINNDETSDNKTNGDDSAELEQICFEIPIQPTQNTLLSATSSARTFFHSRGFSDEEIDEMIADENGQEEDLIVTAMLIAASESGDESSYANNFSNLFFNSAYALDSDPKLTWREVGACALAAIGADLLYSVPTEAGSKSVKWQRKAILKFFGKVASRALGVVGVAIAVITFGTCISSAYAS